MVEVSSGGVVLVVTSGVVDVIVDFVVVGRAAVNRRVVDVIQGVSYLNDELKIE